MHAADLDALSDYQFANAWRELSGDERAALPDSVRSACIARYQDLTPWVGQSLERLRAEQGRALLDRERNGNGHDLEPPPVDAAGYDAPMRTPLDWPDLAHKEPPLRQWAIQGWIGMGHVTLMVGAGGIGKSLLAQQIASCVAMGHGFIDEIPTERRALVWACEDDHDEIWRRQIQISQWMKVPLADYAPSLIIEPRHGLANTMITTEFGRPMLTSLIDELATQANDSGAELVVIDNAAQVYGANENDRHAVTMFLNALPGRMPGKAIMLLAHPSRSQGSEFSGSSAWENTARTRLYLGANLPDQTPQEGEEPDPDIRYLSRRKANYSDKDYRKLMFIAGVLRPDPAQGGVMDAIQAGKVDRVVLEALRKLAAREVRATDGKTSPDYLPRLIIDYGLADGCTRVELGKAMRSALLAGTIARGVVGRYSTRAKKEGLIVVEGAPNAQA